MPRLLLPAVLGTAAGLGSAAAQVVEISGGASTEYGAQGGSVLFHGERVDSSVGAGLIAGRPSLGGAVIRKIDRGTLFMGQQDFSLELPTDLFDAGHVFFGSGLGIVRALGSRRGFTGFVGGASQDGGTPLFRTASLGGPALFGQWRQPVGSRCFSTTTALFASTRTGLESLGCGRSPAAAVALTAGVGGGSPYGALSTALSRHRFDLRLAYIASGNAFVRGSGSGVPAPEAVRDNLAFEYRPGRRFTVSLLHQNYLVPAEGGSGASRSALNEASFSVRGRGTAGSLSLLQSSFRPLSGQAGSQGGNSSLTASFERTLRRVQWTETFLGSLEPLGAHTANLINGVGVQVDPHLRLNGNVNVGSGRATFSPGGALLLRSSSFEVNYQLLYLANRPADPFQNSLLFDARVRLLRGLEAHASSTVSPTGAALYSVQLKTLVTRAGRAAAQQGAGAFGNCILHGRVVDGDGKPVDGAALLIGEARVYTDTNGYFLFREKTAHPHPFRVLTDEFLEPGEFHADGAPAMVRTEDERTAPVLRIRIARTTPGAGVEGSGS